MNSFWTLAAQLEKSLIAKSDEQISYVLSEIPRNDPKLDSFMFVKHNVAEWQPPMDLQFEPSPVWHDDATMATDDAAKIYLRNLLSKSKLQMKEMKGEADKKRREVENAKKVRQNIRSGKDNRDEVEVVRAIFSMQEDLHQLDRKRLTAEVETSTVTSVVGDLSFGAQNHNFRPQTFKIPTNCDLCGDRIWGLSAKGFDCRDCGYTCHNKCEMKVPAECPGEQTKEEKKKLKAERQEAANARRPYEVSTTTTSSAAELPALSRQDTMNSLSSGYAASGARSTSALSSQTTDAGPTELPGATSPVRKSGTLRKHRVVAPPPQQYVSAPPPVSNGSTAAKSSEPRGKMMYAYQASGEDEITVDEGQSIVVVEPDGKYSLAFKVCQPKANPVLQMVQDGSVFVQVIQQVSSPLLTWKPLAPPSQKVVLSQYIPHQTFPLQATNAVDLLLPLNAVRRSYSMSSRCTTMRREPKQNGACPKAIVLY